MFARIEHRQFGCDSCKLDALMLRVEHKADMRVDKWPKLDDWAGVIGTFVLEQFASARIAFVLHRTWFIIICAVLGADASSQTAKAPRVQTCAQKLRQNPFHKHRQRINDLNAASSVSQPARFMPQCPRALSRILRICFVVRPLWLILRGKCCIITAALSHFQSHLRAQTR
jgi:hypothetical protein